VLHPVLVAAYPILFLYSQNADITPSRLIVLPLVLSVGAAILVWAALSLVLGNRLKSALMTTVFLVLFYSYGHVHSTLQASFIDRAAASSDVPASRQLHYYISAGYCVLAVGAVYLIATTRRDMAAATRTANVIAAILFLLPLTTLTGNERSRAAHVERREIVAPSTPGRLGYLPDVYYIILDGYARSDTLASHYGFDNGSFTRALERNGFWIASRSTSNYYWTFLSLASSLNMEHVTYLKELMGATSTDRRVAYQATQDNQVARFLRARGYSFIHFASTWGATLENPFADETVHCQAGLFRSEFYRVLAETTWLRAYGSGVTADLAQCHLSNFAMLATIATRPGPKFVFAHFIPPHHPYLFDRHGNVLRNATITNQFELQEKLWERKAQYVDQLAFVNGQVEHAVTGILARSERPPIIVVQSDHGPHVPRAGRRTHELRFANLAAFYLPDQARFIPDTVTPVNLFRHIFNHYFSADLPLLEERHFFSDYRQPYAFTEIALDNRAAREQAR
jgi:hypothetical protein